MKNLCHSKLKSYSLPGILMLIIIETLVFMLLTVLYQHEVHLQQMFINERRQKSDELQHTYDRLTEQDELQSIPSTNTNLLTKSN